MSWIDDALDSIKDAFSAVGDIFSDPLGAFGDILEGTLNFMTFGTYQFAKDALSGLFDINIPYQDRTRMVRAAAGSRQIIYGRALVGGQLVYIESWYDDRKFITMTIVVASHQVEEITAVYANDRKIATARASGNGPMPGFSDGKYNVAGQERHAFAWSADGTQTSWVAPTLFPGGVARNPPNWTPSHVLRGQAYVHVAFWYDEDRFESGLPKIKVEVKGKNDIYDPRTMTTGYTDNQALCTLDAIRWDRMMNVPDSDIDMDAFANAADIADQLVASGPSTNERRYTVNGTIPIDRPPLEVVLSLAAAGAGIPIYTQGQWTYSPGAYAAPVITLDESDLVGGLKFQPGPPKQSRHNKATGTYIDRAQGYEEVEFPQLVIQQYVEDDLEELEKVYNFPFTNSGTMARRLAKIDIERNRYGVTVQLTSKFRALQLTPGDRIALDNEKNGWDGKVFRVEDVEFSFDTGVGLTLREDSSDIYDWTEGDALALDPPPTLQIPDGLTVTAPTGLTVGEELYQTITRSAIKVRMLISWDGDEDGAISAYDIQFRKTGSPEWINAATFWQANEIEIDDVDDESYDIRVRSINAIGIRSDWTETSYTVIGKAAPPPDVPLLFIEQRVLKWAYPGAPLDLAGFLVRFQNGDRPFWADATPMHEGIVTETLFDVSEYSGTKTFLVKAIDTTGNVSENPAILLQGLGDVPVQNVIKTQNEAPTWSTTPQPFNFMVRSEGQTEQFQVISGGMTEDLIVESGANYTGAFINGDGYLEGEEIGGFYGDPESIFYSPDPGVEFYSAEYKRIEYSYFFEVDPQDEGAALSVEVVLSNGFNENLKYIPPGYSGEPLAFPGAITAIAGVYEFRFTVPQQQLPSPPIVEDIITRLDVGDVQERLGDVAIDAAGTRLPIVRNYRQIVVVNMTLQQDGNGATSIQILDKDETLGPLVRAFDDTGTAVDATIDALIQGY